MQRELPTHFSHIARVQHFGQEQRVAAIATLRERGLVEGDGSDLFFWDAEISNDLLDSHFTHMSESTLRNYAQDALRGVAFLRGHNWRELPIGYSINGAFEDLGSKKRTVASFYTVRGLPDTDDLIRRMETNLLRDVSVGFHGGEMRCDICGNSFWDCRHFPGLKYEEKKGDTVSTVLATFTIDGAGLSEVSGVFDGSTPDAMILKAQRCAASGELSSEQVYLLENKYRIALPVKRVYGASTMDKDAPAMNQDEPTGKDTRMNLEELVADVRTTLGVVTDEEVVQSIQTLRTNLAQAQERISALESQAADGAQYRHDLVEEALAEGVRAQGETFDRTLYETTLRSAPLALVKRMRDDWKRVADALLPNGRHTQPEEQKVKLTRSSVVPDSAYA